MKVIQCNGVRYVITKRTNYHGKSYWHAEFLCRKEVHMNTGTAGGTMTAFKLKYLNFNRR